MSQSRATAIICACALVANIAAIPAPPRKVNKEIETMPTAPERSIVIRRVYSAYFYPFSLFPIPRHPIPEDRTAEFIYNGKTMKKIKKEKTKQIT